MFNYLKISLLALLSMGSLLAMELPEQQKIRFSDMADSNSILELSIPDALRAKTLANFGAADAQHHALLSLPSQEFNAIKTIKDFLVFDNTHQDALLEALNKKDNPTLCNIINAADYLEAKDLLEAAMELLAERLNHPAMQVECLKNNSYNLTLNAGAANLVAQKMDQQKPVMLPFLLHKQSEKYGAIPRTILEGSGNMRSICMSEDGENIVSASYDRDVHIWSMRPEQYVEILESHKDTLPGTVCVTPDGKYITSASSDNKIRIRDIKTGKCIRTLEGHPECLLSVRISEDGKYIISFSMEAITRIWDFQTGKCIYALKDQTDNRVCMSKDGKHIIVGTFFGNTIGIWDIEKEEYIRILAGHTNRINAIRMSGDGKYIISGSADNTIRIWDMQTGECKRTLVSQRKSIESICVSEDGNYIISGSHDGATQIWDMQTGECIRTLEKDNSRSEVITAVRMGRGGRYIISGSIWGKVYVWEIADWLLAQEYKKNLTPEKVTEMRIYCAGK